MGDVRYRKPSSSGTLLKDALIVSYLSLSGVRSAPVLVLSLTYVLMLVGCATRASAPPTSPPIVEVVSVVQQDVPIYSEWVAVLDGYVNAQIQPHVSGYLIKQNYKEGSVVGKGDVLFSDRPSSVHCRARSGEGAAGAGRGAAGESQTRCRARYAVSSSKSHRAEST
jgi:hypothetical protein